MLVFINRSFPLTLSPSLLRPPSSSTSTPSSSFASASSSQDDDGEMTKTERGREFEGSSRRGGFHLSGFPRTRASPYPIFYPRQFPSVNSIIYRYTPHPCGSTSASLPTRPPSPLRSDPLRPSLRRPRPPSRPRCRRRRRRQCIFTDLNFIFAQYLKAGSTLLKKQRIFNSFN
ncbi:hypothetical protein PUN28_010728 [Cardiocondyla obscurior]|uniref:Uncharacterized protein n=1 Tax=Cardiocondyla obscurior TaxID=286306 RepID=A0AAW2FHU7_9HYME